MLENSLFHKLPLRSQFEDLASTGILLAQRQVNGSTVQLYMLNNQFMECWLKDGMQFTTTFRPGASTMAILESYMDSIAIENLNLAR
jgi:hypothetical protein